MKLWKVEKVCGVAGLEGELNSLQKRGAKIECITESEQFVYTLVYTIEDQPDDFTEDNR